MKIEDKHAYFRFLIITSKIENEELFRIIKDLFFEPYYIEYKDLLVVIYHDKTRLNLQDVMLSLSEDIGERIKTFEGFCIRKENKQFLEEFLEIYYQYLNKTDLLFSNITDLVFRVIKNEYAFDTLKKMILTDVKKDEQFLLIVKAMFDNDLNVSKAANAIYMHRNTLNNKLDNLENYTSLSLRKFRDAVAMYELIK